MTNEPLDLIPLRLANYCENCESVTKRGNGSACPSCGSQAIRPLSAFLNRESEPVQTVQCGKLVMPVAGGGGLYCDLTPNHHGDCCHTMEYSKLPRTLPELSELIQVSTPESIRKMLGYPQEQ